MEDTKPCNKKLKGKVAIITGGASGIGEATAHLFAEHGAAAIVIADIQDYKGQEVAASVGHHCACTYIHCDITNEQNVESMIQSTIQKYGRLDIMFCNAGVANKGQTILEFDFESYQNLFAVNVTGVAAGVKYAARAMAAADIKGSIICTASVAAGMSIEGNTDYVMSKSAVVALVRCASVQLGGRGIRVNCVSPGPVATPMLCEVSGKGVAETETTFASFYCLKNNGVLKVKHVADAVLFLASDDSQFITGHNLVVDGGVRASPNTVQHWSKPVSDLKTG